MILEVPIMNKGLMYEKNIFVYDVSWFGGLHAD
jgi:hypothetical protein